MLRLAKYLNPYLIMILVVIALLFVQAMADLALPDYMSRIVNTGIQQGGVQEAAPLAVRQAQMNRLVLFLSDTEKERVLGDYTLIDSGSGVDSDLIKAYPGLADAPVYIRDDIGAEEVYWLSPVMSRAMLAVSGLEQAAADPEKAAQLGGQIDFSKLPPGTDIFAILQNLPAAQRQVLLDQMQAAFGSMDEEMLLQAGIQAARSEYDALGMDSGAIQTNYILSTGGVMLLLTLVAVVCTVFVGYLSAIVAAGLSRDLRSAVFGKVESFSNTEFDRFSTASLITRSTNDVTQVQMFVLIMMRMVFYAPIVGVGGIIRAVDKDSSMWWIIALGVGVLLGLILVIFSLSIPKFQIIQKLIDRLNLVSREHLSGMMVIRAFNRQAFEEKRFDRANVELTDANLFVNRVMVFMFPSLMLIMNAMSLLIIWVGADQVAASRMQVGDMMAFMQYAIQIVFSFMMMSFMFILIPRASVSGARIAEVLDVEPVIRDPEKAVRMPEPSRGVVEFRNVSFRYPNADEDVLCSVSFTARPGQTTAIIGSTGSGKSTVVNLIPRFYDVTGGAIFVDGVDIRTISQQDLRDKIGYIPQRANLFSGTIGSNLRYADEGASQAVIDAAVDVAQAAEFVKDRSEGLAAEISQGGANVSGGQKQRLSIARALVKRAPIYIFDDSFSALDFKTDAALRRAMKEYTADSTILIVTQRVSTIKNAEQIVVLDNGQVVGQGTHSELMENCDTYREIALSQLSVEELA